MRPRAARAAHAPAPAPEQAAGWSPPRPALRLRRLAPQPLRPCGRRVQGVPAQPRTRRVAVQLHGTQLCCPAACRVTPQRVGGRNAFGHDEPASAQSWRRLCRIRRGYSNCGACRRRLGAALVRQPRRSGWRRRSGRSAQVAGAGWGWYRPVAGPWPVRLAGARWRAGHHRNGRQGRRRPGGGFRRGLNGHAHLLVHGALARIKGSNSWRMGSQQAGKIEGKMGGGVRITAAGS